MSAGVTLMLPLRFVRHAGRPHGRCHRPHEGLVAISEVGVDHIQVTVSHGDIDGLADCPPGTVQCGAHIGELHEIAEVFEGGVTATRFEIVNKGGSVRGNENTGVTSDLEIPARIARMMGKASGRGRRHDLPT